MLEEVGEPDDAVIGSRVFYPAGEPKLTIFELARKFHLECRSDRIGTKDDFDRMKAIWL